MRDDDVPTESRRDRNHRHRTHPRRLGTLLLSLVALLVATTIAGLVLLWPGERHQVAPFAAPGATVHTGTVASSHSTPCSSGGATATTPSCAMAQVLVDDGPDKGQVVDVQIPPDAVAAGLTNQIRIIRAPARTGAEPAYSFQDLQRGTPLLVLAAVFVLAVVVVARWRGLLALAGLAYAAAVMFTFMLPALLAGSSPVLVGLTAASAIMVVALYAAHGFSARTTVALLGTMAGLAITAVIAVLAVGGAHLTGNSSDDSSLLSQQTGSLSTRDLLLCGILLAGLGVLNDVTITQSSAVWELRAAAPAMSRRELFGTAMRIGRDHIASTIYTIVFAYAGAALSVLLLIVLYAQPASFTLNSNDIAEEVVRTLASSIGLVLAVPMTTVLAVLMVPSRVTSSGAH